MKILNFISIYSWKKKFLANKYKKQMCYKENKSLFFWRYEKWPNFSFKSLSIFDMVTDPISVEKWGTLERARRYVCKNLLNLNCSIVQDTTIM